MTDLSNPPDPPRPASYGDAPRSSRSRDFWAIGIAAALVMVTVSAVAQAGWLPPLIGALTIAAFCFGWYFGTVDPAATGSTDQAEADLATARQKSDSERRFRIALVEALPEAAMYIDAQGKVEAANALARRQFRVVGPEPLLTAVVRRPELLDAVAAARAGQPQSFEIVERDETDRYFACVAAPLGAGVLVNLHDLTEIKRAEFARVDFLANASHELRTPLTSLAGFIETLRGPARDDPAARERFLEIMQAQADRMRRLISDLLSLSRIELIEHRPPEGEADFAAVISEVADALSLVAADRKVTLKVTGDEKAVMVTGVRDELTQVVQNLIDNAVKYSEDGGVVEVEIIPGLRRDEAEAAAGRRWEGAGRMSIVTAAGRDGGRYAMLRVSDAGPGIERQYLPRLSERFYRVDPGRGLRPGTGLGLAIVKHVVQRHRGEFLVESEPGRGTAFGVILPMA